MIIYLLAYLYFVFIIKYSYLVYINMPAEFSVPINFLNKLISLILLLLWFNDFENNTIVDITESSFIIRNASISDTKFKSKGILEGRVKHNKFSDWVLDLKVKCHNLSFTIKNNYLDSGSRLSSTGIGIENLKRRLEVYGLKHTLSCKKENIGGEPFIIIG